jgi:hypothetical protein
MVTRPERCRRGAAGGSGTLLEVPSSDVDALFLGGLGPLVNGVALFLGGLGL